MLAWDIVCTKHYYLWRAQGIENLYTEGVFNKLFLGKAMAMMDELPWIHYIYFPFHHKHKQVEEDIQVSRKMGTEGNSDK